MDFKEKLKKIKDSYENSSIQADASDLEDSDICPFCHGTEWIIEIRDGIEFAKPCRCREKAALKRRIRFADIPETFRDMQLKTFSINAYQTENGKETARLACKIIKAYLESFESEKENGMGLYIHSNTKGSGKTRMAASIANELIEKYGCVVKFSTSTKIISEIKKTYDHNFDSVTESQLMEDLAMTDVLVIDDFGTENVTPWVKDKFYQIINQRYVNRDVMIFTSNESLKTLSYDDRIRSRIKERCYQVDFPEESVRDHLSEIHMKEIMDKIIK